MKATVGSGWPQDPSATPVSWYIQEQRSCTMSQYRRLTLVEREELSRLFVAGHTVRAAARALGRAPSTVSRELARHYRTRVAHHTARARTRATRRPPRPRRPPHL